jgi:pimeloyl-ACP methyl ester carboxylesterase
VALHGIPTSADLFAPLVPHLDGIRTIAPDLSGQGLTDAPTRGRLDFASYLRHLSEFFELVAPPEFHLLLHDMGGVLGLKWALSNPHRIRSLVLLSTTVTPSWRIRLLYALNLVLGRAALRYGMPWTLRSRRVIDAELLDQWAAPWTRRRLTRGTDHFSRSHLRRNRAALSGFSRPVLLIWGKEDNVFPIAHAQAILNRLPLAELAALPRCGHWSPHDQPEAVARLVRVFCLNPNDAE